jgi:hypothetical protein
MKYLPRSVQDYYTETPRGFRYKNRIINKQTKELKNTEKLLKVYSNKLTVTTNDYESLTEYYHNLCGAYVTIEVENKFCQEEIDSLQKNFDKLKTENDSLGKKYTELCNQTSNYWHPPADSSAASEEPSVLYKPVPLSEKETNNYTDTKWMY